MDSRLSIINVSAWILLFFCMFESGHSLECYTCNATSSVLNENACQGIQSLTKCQDPALCLSATYLYEDGLTRSKMYSTIKSCYIKMTGNECDNFISNMKQTYPMSAKLEFVGKKCTTCEGKGCNESSSASVVLPAIFVFVFSYIPSRLV